MNQAPLAAAPRPLVLLGALLVVLTACTVPADDVEDLAAPFGESSLVLSGGSEEVELAAYVADTPRLRRQGLQGWSALPEHTGMLFAYEEDTSGGFWMKDTLIELSIAFADGSGRIHTILDMEPCERQPCPSYAPDQPYRYALEVEQGVFDELGVQPGWMLEPINGP